MNASARRPVEAVPGDPYWCAAHGIDPTVFVARGVWRYGTSDEDCECVKDAFRAHLPRTQLGTVTKIVHQCGGLVLLKHAPPGFDPVIPQLRPDHAVLVDTREKWHYHGPDRHPVFPPEAGTNRAGKHLPKVLRLWGDEAIPHINRDKGDRYNLETGYGLHFGEDRDDVHFHLAKAKYVLLGEGLNQRIDLHPWALEKLASADRVFFVLEGTLKNDAVLSAGEAVFSVPSVTLWDPRELRRFAGAFLRAKTVFVVPDADGISNPAVARQALLVRTCLRRADVKAYIAAPPARDDQRQCKCEPVGRTSNGADCDLCGGYLKGIDDFLGAGGTIGDLLLTDREAPQSIDDWAWAGSWSRVERRRRAGYALEGLALHANEEGSAYLPLGTLARIMGVRKRDVLATLEDLSNAIDVEGSLATEVEVWNGREILDWVERPTIFVKPEFRAIEKPDAVRLGGFSTGGTMQEHRADVIQLDARRRSNHQREVIERIDRMEARLAETLVSIQSTVRALADRWPDDELIRRAAEDWQR